jgi:16S rRNA (cytidine1402-2'-O)-methyltransferase
MLYLCATPIGNLQDITLRVLDALRNADAVWAEDTRHTMALLTHFEIKKPMVSCHAHNEQARGAMLIEALRAGKNIAYCSDAGMPGISDPGAGLVKVCIEHGLPFTVLPGASAAVTAAVGSGLHCAEFAFYGFLPREKKERREKLTEVSACKALVILYESPVRIPATLQELCGLLGPNRQAAVLRELTKLHEDTVRGTLSELAARYAEPPKGECVIVIEGAPKEAPAACEDDALRAALQRLLDARISPKDAAAAASILLGVQKKRAYQMCIALTNGE